MDQETDQTNFWLAWDATCAGADCTDGELIRKRIEELCRDRPDLAERFQPVLADLEGTVRLSREMNASVNKTFRDTVSYFNHLYGNRRNSDYADVLQNWKDSEPKHGCAFSLVESKLYANESIKGRPFKEYLMEVIGTRNKTVGSNLGSNLCGYVNRLARTIARESFSKSIRVEEKTDDEGRVLESPSTSTDTRWDYSSLSPAMQTDIRRVSSFFSEYVDALGKSDGDEPAAWDDDNWISLYCAIHQIPINNPEVRGLCKRKKSALADVYNKTVGNLLLVLRQRLQAGDRAIAWAFEGEIPFLLDKRLRDMTFYPELERIRIVRLNSGTPKTEKRV